MRWIHGLLQEIEKIDKLSEIRTPATDGADLLGEIPDELKKLYTYCDLMQKKILELRREQGATDSKQAERELGQHICRLQERRNVAMAIMWQEIKLEYRDKIDPTRGLVLHSGFNLYMEPPAPPMPPFIKNLFDPGSL